MGHEASAAARVLLAQATAPLVRELLTESWRGKAPKKVLVDFDG